jgi:hypothetical protein
MRPEITPHQRQRQKGPQQQQRPPAALPAASTMPLTMAALVIAWRSQWPGRVFLITDSEIPQG